MPDHGALPGREVEALTKRFLEGEPGVSARSLKGGLGFLCGPAFGQRDAAPRLFAVATVGGVLLRLDEASRDRLIENGTGHANAALPDWLIRLESKEGPPAPPSEEDQVGAPEEWIWVPLADGVAFERRRPHIQEALAYGRHCLATPRTD